jgi:hypothetical protein
LVVVVASIAFAAIIVLLARRRLITLRYALGWLLIAALGLSAAFLGPVIEWLAERLGMTQTGLLLAAATGVLVAIAVQLSISVSGLQSQVRDLSEAHALLARRLEEATAPVDEPG